MTGDRLTLSYGLRFETQNDFSDHSDFAPRLGIAWGLGGNVKNPPKTILRAGFGMFYDRFTYNLVLQQERQGGLEQANYQIAYQIPNPTFPLSGVTLPPAQLTSSTTPTIYQTNPNLHAPYTIQIGVTLERQLTKSANIAVTYLSSRGVHQFYTDNLNAYNPVLGERPLGLQENIFQYQSEGTFKQNQLIVNGSPHGFGTNQLWSISYPGCSVHRITNDINSYTGVSATADFASILTLQRIVNASIWLVRTQGNSRQIGQSPGAEEGRAGLAWMKDGAILYTYIGSERWGLGIMQPDGSRVSHLTLDSHNYDSPSVSPDGNAIVVSSDRDGLPVAVWRMSRDGSSAKRLSASFGIRPIFSSDGKWVFFYGRKDATYGLQKVRSEGGVQEFVSVGTGAPIGDSIDSTLVASIQENDTGAMWRVVLTPVDGGQPKKSSSWISKTETSIPDLDDPAPRLTRDGKQIIYVSNKDGIQNLWSRDFDVSHVKQLSHFTDSQHIFWFAVGDDGKIAVSRGTSASDIVLIRSWLKT